MSDRRHFAKIDVGYLDNPKTVQYLDDRPHLILFHLQGVSVEGPGVEEPALPGLELPPAD